MFNKFVDFLKNGNKKENAPKIPQMTEIQAKI